MAIQLFVPHFEVEECLGEIRECLEKGWTGLGFKTVEFETKWRDYSDLPHAHFLNSNTVGLHLALNILKKKHGWMDGDEVLTTPLTFVSTNHAILYERLKPVFADVDESLCLDPDSVLERITPNTKAVMFVGMGGNVGQYESIRNICRERGLKLILDAAHMTGTRFNGRHVGHDADVSVFSFQAVKNLGTGDSGMICFADGELDALARKMSWLGIDKDTYQRTSDKGTYKWKYDVIDAGFKYHGNSIMAAIGLVQLKQLDRYNSYRSRVAQWYREDLLGQRGIGFVPITEGCESSYHLFQVKVKNRDEVLEGLNQREIYPGVHYRDNTEYELYSYGAKTCPYAHSVSQELLSLPIHVNLTRKDINKVAGSLVELVSG
ncbi:MAG: DegT/DnrJ/EryC1/StrS family aminotransferase [Bdellovibrionales bacterium]|nr:DegT/DnrJ/EryC1/StrS family aminotransferase [Bdellovibrionales bacterium]